MLKLSQECIGFIVKQQACSQSICLGKSDEANYEIVIYIYTYQCLCCTSGELQRKDCTSNEYCVGLDPSMTSLLNQEQRGLKSDSSPNGRSYNWQVLEKHNHHNLSTSSGLKRDLRVTFLLLPQTEYRERKGRMSINLGYVLNISINTQNSNL